MTQQQQHQQQHIQYIEVVIDGGDEEVIDDERKKYTCSPFDNTCTRIRCPRVTWQDLKILAQDCFQETGRIIFLYCVVIFIIHTDEEDNIDALSTKAHIDREELPPVSRLRICLQERRSKFLPLSVIFGGSLTVLISVSCINHQTAEISNCLETRVTSFITR